MDRIHRMLTGMGGAGQGGPPGDTPQVDTAEQIYISSLALLKMLKHGEQLLANAAGMFGSCTRQLNHSKLSCCPHVCVVSTAIVHNRMWFSCCKFGADGL
jgi:hypothetical protein